MNQQDLPFCDSQLVGPCFCKNEPGLPFSQEKKKRTKNKEKWKQKKMRFLVNQSLLLQKSTRPSLSKKEKENVILQSSLLQKSIGPSFFQKKKNCDSSIFTFTKINRAFPFQIKKNQINKRGDSPIFTFSKINWVFLFKKFHISLSIGLFYLF